MHAENKNCNCKSEYPIVLQYQLTEHAIVCSNCNLDRVIDIPDDLNLAINKWNHEYGTIYKDWLISENKIKELSDFSSDIHKQGVKIVMILNDFVTTYYWWHVVDEENIIKKCPNCQNILQEVENKYSDFHKTCTACNLLINQ